MNIWVVNNMRVLETRTVQAIIRVVNCSNSKKELTLVNISSTFNPSLIIKLKQSLV